MKTKNSDTNYKRWIKIAKN